MTVGDRLAGPVPEEAAPMPCRAANGSHEHQPSARPLHVAVEVGREAGLAAPARAVQSDGDGSGCGSNPRDIDGRPAAFAALCAARRRTCDCKSSRTRGCQDTGLGQSEDEFEALGATAHLRGV